MIEIQTTNPARAVIVISSHVVRGAVGNRVVSFVLEAMGHPVWAMPTVVLPWHPGHGPSTRMAFPDDMFDKAIDDLIASRWVPEVKAIISGYFGSSRQVEAVARLVTALKARNPELLYLCDPVIGDDGGLYIAEATAIAIRDHLMPIATLATPNSYEMGWLSGKTLETNKDIIGAASGFLPQKLVITSAHAMMADSVANLLLSNGKAVLVEHRKIGGSHSGTGDLLASTLLARLLDGETEERALEHAASSVFEIVARSVKKGSDELLLAEESGSLRNPMAMVQMRNLHQTPGGKAKFSSKPLG